MIDFLRSNPWCTREEYMWGMSVPQVRLSNFDFSHVEYLSEDEKNKKKSLKNAVVNNSAEDLMKNFNDFGFPIL